MANSGDYYNMDAKREYEVNEYIDSLEKSGGKMQKMPGFSPRDLLSGVNIRGLAIAVVLVLCLVLTVSNTIAVNKLRSTIEESNLAIASELHSVREINSEVLAHLSALEQGVSTTQSALSGAESSKYIQITKQPSSTPTYIGRDAAMIFQVTAEGNNLKMTWQKYDEVSGEWINLVFDIDGNNPEMGIRLYDDSAHGVSELWTKGLTAKAFGTYRCLLTDSMGAEVRSDVVQLTEKTME